MRQFVIMSVFVGFAAIGCGGVEGEFSQTEDALRDKDLNDLKRAFRQATARYHNTARLAQDGWVQLQPECFTEVFSEGGGGTINLGIVFLRPDRMDGTIDPSAPEILYFEPQANGNLKLMGGEYFCPVDACPTPPTLFNQTFRFEEDTGGHALHVWAWLQNPNGLTHPVNPNVDTTHCP